MYETFWARNRRAKRDREREERWLKEYEWVIPRETVDRLAGDAEVLLGNLRKIAEKNNWLGRVKVDELLLPAGWYRSWLDNTLRSINGGAKLTIYNDGTIDALEARRLGFEFIYKKDHMTKTTVYLAGRMRGVPEFNFPLFDEAAQKLRDLGYEVTSPAEHDRTVGFDPKGLTGYEDLQITHGFDFRESLMWDLEQVAKVDEVFVLPDSENSKGTAAEIALAKALGKPVYHYKELWFTADDASAEPEDDYDSEFALTAPVDFLIGGKKIGTVSNVTVEGGGVYGGASLTPEQLGGEFVTDGDTVRFNRFTGETRTTSSTGGQKGKKLAQMSALDPNSILKVAEVAGFGAEKYAKLNFMKGYDWSLSYDALQRHIQAFWNGQDNDEESEMLHIAHAAWHCLTLISFYERGLGTDDRYSSTPDLCSLQTKTIG